MSGDFARYIKALVNAIFPVSQNSRKWLEFRIHVVGRGHAFFSDGPEAFFFSAMQPFLRRKWARPAFFSVTVARVYFGFPLFLGYAVGIFARELEAWRFPLCVTCDR